jgi:nitrite reductase/ring-hydroxylating ferredoxin subunit
LEPHDAVAFIGRNPHDDENIYIVTGDSGTGLTHGTIAGILIPDLIMGRGNSWAKLFDPSRISLRAARDYARENINMAAQYGDWLSAGEVKSADAIPPGEGAIVRRGLRKIAAYRDESGALIELSAACPHLGGVVRWNAAEKTWDCPCHGSRFSCMGGVINGPALSGLEPLMQERPRPAGAAAEQREPETTTGPAAPERTRAAADRSPHANETRFRR